MALNIFKFLGKSKKDSSVEPQTQAARATVPGVLEPGRSAPEILAEGMLNVRDIIAPSAIEVDFNHMKIGNNYYRTIFISGYPRFVGANWLSPIINFDHSLDVSMFYYPVKAKMILDDLRRKITELEATELSDREKGRITDPVVRAALEDAQALQEQLVKGVEKYFQFSFYITVSADSLDELESVSSRLESTLGSLLLISKPATLQMEEAFQSTLPAGSDKLMITRNMDTTSLATTFPFTSSDLTSDEGIMYGINMHNGSLVVFDRFSMENANSVIFAKSGAGKSYYVKLEALRLMIFGAEVMIIDPEEEYRTLCEAVGGNYVDFSPSSEYKINPFDLSGVVVEGENELGQKLLSLHTLLKLMLGEMNPTEEAILDRSLIETYRIKGITTDPETQMTKEPPIMEDLYKVLQGMQEKEARGMSDRLEKYIKGSMAGIFDSQSTTDIEGIMTVFSTKNIEDEVLRPVAFYIILDFVWTKIRRDLKKRILIVEEAWYLMQNEDSARFIYGVAKRARKYYLGLTTISQDVDDFLSSDYGKAIVTNSSIQILLKQHPAAIDQVAETFYLSEGERRLLLSADVGEGLFFAGSNHVAMKIKASPSEHKLITTDPEELLRLREEGVIGQKEKKQPTRPVYKPVTTFDSNKYETLDAQGQPIAQPTPEPAPAPAPPPLPQPKPAPAPQPPQPKPAPAPQPPQPKPAPAPQPPQPKPAPAPVPPPVSKDRGLKIGMDKKDNEIRKPEVVNQKGVDVRARKLGENLGNLLGKRPKETLSEPHAPESTPTPIQIKEQEAAKQGPSRHDNAIAPPPQQGQNQPEQKRGTIKIGGSDQQGNI
ncbi:VirB4-like conjugal transfer ATPase, CD1110 family [Patescibacteria group bacterium]